MDKLKRVVVEKYEFDNLHVTKNNTFDTFRL